MVLIALRCALFEWSLKIVDHSPAAIQAMITNWQSGRLFNRSKHVVCATASTLHPLHRLYHRLVRFPKQEAQCRRLSEQFSQIGGLRNVVSASRFCSFISLVILSSRLDAVISLGSRNLKAELVELPEDRADARNTATASNYSLLLSYILPSPPRSLPKNALDINNHPSKEPTSHPWKERSRSHRGLSSISLSELSRLCFDFKKT